LPQEAANMTKTPSDRDQPSYLVTFKVEADSPEEAHRIMNKKLEDAGLEIDDTQDPPVVKQRPRS
jgi:hypothetical protein